jgi:hypothetical protein
VKAIVVNIEKVDTACSIFSFGYGRDHDETMLRYVRERKGCLYLNNVNFREIAEAGKGLYYFIETLDGML